MKSIASRLPRLLLPRTPRLLVAAPLLLLLSVGAAWLIRGAEAAVWEEIAHALRESNVEYDVPGRHCPDHARSHQYALVQGSIFALRRWLEDEVPSERDRLELAKCVEIAVAAENGL